jgi:hypothetical protein
MSWWMCVTRKRGGFALLLYNSFEERKKRESE